MKEIKRAVCLMLCFVMAFGLLPVHANALDLDVSELQPGEFVEEIIAGDALEEPEEGTPAELAEPTATGNLPGGTYYVLDTAPGALRECVCVCICMCVCVCVCVFILSFHTLPDSVPWVI